MHFVTHELGAGSQKSTYILPTPLNFYFFTCSNLPVGSSKYHQVKGHSVRT